MYENILGKQILIEVSKESHKFFTFFFFFSSKWKSVFHNIFCVPNCPSSLLNFPFIKSQTYLDNFHKSTISSSTVPDLTITKEKSAGL